MPESICSRQRISDEVYVELVELLYRSLRTVISVVSTASVAAVYIAHLTRSPVDVAVAIATVAACFGRVFVFPWFWLRRSRSMPLPEARAWARRYGLPSVALGLSLGTVCFRAFQSDLGLSVMVPFGMVMAYSIGAATRTAVVPWITIATAAGMLVPAAAGAALRPEMPFQLCAAFALVNLFATVECGRHLHRTFTERLLAQKALAERAAHDGLTGLPNRAEFERQLAEACSRPGINAVLFLDLDQFKPVNDHLGHAAGDQLLRDVAVRLRAVLGERSLPYRLGGDEFAVLMTQVASPEDASATAERIIAGLQEPYALSQGNAWIGVSVGIAFAAYRDDPDRSLSTADQALYAVKRSGRGAWCVAARPKVELAA